jgi:GT2 family glycosyltransferase
MSGGSLRFSVVVPAHQASALLPQSLAALQASELSRDLWELIVVDDASTDGTGVVASRFADVVVRLPAPPRGPAYARNRGFEAARGSTIVFVDADVCVHPDTLSGLAAQLDSAPDVGAVFGSYDAHPPAPGFISQYKNLLHHFVHQSNGGDVEVFWAGCGAVRRAVFVEAGMYDEWHFARPQIEDIELGQRIRAHGHRIVLCQSLLCTHLKKWTLRELIQTDARDRGIPWARLYNQDSPKPATATLNLTRTERASTALVWTATAIAGLALVLRQPVLLAVSLLAGIPVFLLNLPLFRLFRRERGLLFALAAAPIHVLHYLLTGVAAVLGLVMRETFGAPVPDPTIDAYSEVGVKTWPPVPSRRKGQ